MVVHVVLSWQIRVDSDHELVVDEHWLTVVGRGTVPGKQPAMMFSS